MPTRRLVVMVNGIWLIQILLLWKKKKAKRLTQVSKIYYRYKDSDDDYELAEDGTVFETGRKVRFKIQVKNYTDIREPDYTVSIYDEDGRIGRTTGETPAREDEINNAYVDITVDYPGEQELTFKIILEDSRWTNTNKRNNTRYRTFQFEETGGIISQEEINRYAKANDLSDLQVKALKMINDYSDNNTIEKYEPNLFFFEGAGSYYRKTQPNSHNKIGRFGAFAVVVKNGK